MANPHASKTLSPPTSPKIRTKADQNPQSRSASHASAHHRLVDYESLLRLFECPACRGWIVPPIAQCRKGHVICSQCRQTIKACATCKQRFSDVPNLMMEQISWIVAFPCKFQPHGCREFNLLSDKVNHEAFCSFRPVPCQYSSRGCSRVQQFYLMEQHVQICPYRISAIKID